MLGFSSAPRAKPAAPISTAIVATATESRLRFIPHLPSGSEDQLHANAEDSRRLDAFAIGDLPLLTRANDLEVRRQQHPRRDRDVVERFEPPFVTQERLGSGDGNLKRRIRDGEVVVADATAIERPFGHDPFAADTEAPEVVERIGFAVGSAEAPEEPNSTPRVRVDLVHELIEIIIDGPRT